MHCNCKTTGHDPNCIAGLNVTTNTHQNLSFNAGYIAGLEKAREIASMTSKIAQLEQDGHEASNCADAIAYKITQEIERTKKRTSF